MTERGRAIGVHAGCGRVVASRAQPAAHLDGLRRHAKVESQGPKAESESTRAMQKSCEFRAVKRSGARREPWRSRQSASTPRALSLRRVPPRQLRRAPSSAWRSRSSPAPARRRPTPSLASSDGPLQPPPDIKNIVDKTAQFVARNGPEFEQRILSDNEKKQNPKFAFLQASDPFHAYYVAKVQELGGTTTRRAGGGRGARGGGGGAGRGAGVGRRDGGGVEEEEGAERDAARAGAADAHGAEAAGRAAARPRRDPAHRAVRRAQRPHLPDGDREPRGAQPPVRLPQADAPPLLVLHVARRRLLGA